MQRRDIIATRTAAYVALGQRRYRVEHITDPILTGISDVATLGDKIVVLRRQSPQLIVLGHNGTSLETSVELPQLVCGHGLRKISNGRLAVTDMDGHKVIVIDDALNEVTRMDCDDHPQLGLPFNHPCDCVQGPDGRFYVADGYGNSTVHIFSTNLEHLKTFGEPGTGKGAFSTPHSLLFDVKGQLCVADRENDRVQIFDPDGNWLSQINGVYRPMALALTLEGLLLVTDQTPRLSAYDKEGNLVGRCRTFSTYGHGLTQQPDETIIIADMAPDRLTLLKPVATAINI